MAQPYIWFEGNDMVVSLTGLRSSTMAATSYLNNSTGVRVSIFDGPTTNYTRIITDRVCSYVAASNGVYRATIQSVESTAFTQGENGLAVFTLSQSGLNGKWNLNFSAQKRGTS